MFSLDGSPLPGRGLCLSSGPLHMLSSLLVLPSLFTCPLGPDSSTFLQETPMHPSPLSLGITASEKPSQIPPCRMGVLRPQHAPAVTRGPLSLSLLSWMDKVLFLSCLPSNPHFSERMREQD